MTDHAALDLGALAEIGRGMEGVVYRLPGGRIAKAWFTRDAAQLRPLAEFYAELSLPFATPEILDIVERDGQVVTIERELTGVPLSSSGLDLAQQRERAVTVLAALAAAATGPAARALPVFGTHTPLWTADTWRASLVNLLELRLAKDHQVLRAALPTVDAIAERVAAALPDLAPEAERAVHGDLCRPNVLVDAAGNISGLLDWGFLSTAGDPAFDAATFAVFFDMYGPAATEQAAAMTALVTTRLGYAPELLRLYQAYYALIGAAAYDETGQDGHFAWCVSLLRNVSLP
ncbi:aminoglycoside phosphotransferase family protein [Hamadaea sp. NPDC051192]|uniref:aminoglycoside phosphotransferase family protein n=1 Tax=Hamadaea sp. NPDC051192 TaxID=3154940 RepID=UPI0034224AA0